MQTNILGHLQETPSHDRHGRIIDPSNDIYPNCCMTKEPSKKVYKNERLFSALAYLKINRIAELLKLYGHLANNLDFHTQREQESHQYQAEEHIIWQQKERCYEKIRLLREKYSVDNNVDFLAVDYYGQNILHNICARNTGGNLCYSSNQKLYEDIFSLLLTQLSPFAIHTLLRQKSRFNRTPVEEALRNNIFHFALALLKNGSPIPELSETDKDESPYLVSFYKNPKRVKEFVGICNGTKREICPITQEPIQIPAVLEDGSIYERNAIVQWFMTRPVEMAKFYQYSEIINLDNVSSIERVFCAQWSGMYTYKSPVTNIDLVGDPIVYLPQSDEFLFV
jgi:hypothetical protein